MPRPDKRTVFITGTSRGIGRHLASHFLARGDDVIGCSRKPADIDQPGYTHHLADIGDERAMVGVFRAVRKSHGGLDVVVNNAGIASMNHALLTPLSTLERMVRTNFFGTFLCCREAVPLMRGRAGRIINLSTIAVPLSLEGEAAYASTKSAVETFTRVLSKEVAPMGITVNAIGPSALQTDLLRSVPDDKVQRILEKQSIRELARFEDVENVVEFLARPQSRFVTGQVLYLGGVV